MIEKLKQAAKNKNNLIVILLLGVLLLVIALPTKKPDTAAGEETVKLSAKEAGSTKTADMTGDTALVQDTLNGKEQTAQTDSGNMDEYTASMEQKLEDILSRMAGVGKVKTFITVKSSSEKVIEKDEPVTRSNTNEQDAEGGNRSINNVDMGETTVYSTQSGSTQPYVVKVLQPQVEGVMVVAEGAGSGEVNNNITEAVGVLFNIEANKIKVVKMEKSNKP